MRTIEDVLNRLRAEFLDTPGLQVKGEEVQRLCGLERRMCQVALGALVNETFLYVTANGHYLGSRNTRRPVYTPEASPDANRGC